MTVCLIITVLTRFGRFLLYPYFCIIVIWLPASMGIVPFRQTAIKANKYSLSIWQPTSSSQLKSLDIMLLILCPSLTHGNTSQAPTHFATSPTFSEFFRRSLWNSAVFPGVLDEWLPWNYSSTALVPCCPGKSGQQKEWGVHDESDDAAVTTSVRQWLYKTVECTQTTVQTHKYSMFIAHLLGHLNSL